MTSRPRGKRTTTPTTESSSASSAAKGAKKKTGARRGRSSAGGKAEKRPPRVSMPPTMGAPKPKKAAAKPAPAKKPAARPAAKPAPSAARPSSPPSRSAAAPSAQQAAAPRQQAPARAPQGGSRPPAQQPPRQPAPQQRPPAPSMNGPAPARPPQQQPPRPAQGGQPQRPVQQHGAPQQQPRPMPPQQTGRPPHGQHGQHPQQRHAPQPPGQRPAPQRGPQPQGVPQDRRDQRDHRDHRDPRPPAPQQGYGQRPPAPAGQHGLRPQHNQQQMPRPQQPRPSAPPAPTPAPASEASPAAAAASGPAKQPLGNAAPAGFNQKAFEEIFEKDIPFSQLGLNEWVLKGVTEAGFEYPTSIQAKLIPTILAGRDVLGQAKTGTGKTASFALPMLNAIGKGDSFSGLVLVPTRELAIQVATDYRELGRYTGLNILPVYGGQNINTQAQALSRGPEIIIATPGRVMDMAQRGYLHHRNVKMVVLDEVDRMLDIGFRDDIRRILSACPKDRQTVFVSATMQPEIEQLARTFARECEKIIASAGALTVAMVKQFYLSVEPWDKKQLLLHLLTHESPALTVVFCRTKRTVDNLAEYLSRKGIEAHAIHGDMQQGRRNRVIEQLRSGKLSVLIASDLASRGLDVEGITHVINYDLPEDPDLYVHRIGRTARAGRDGVAWALVTPEQGPLLTEIELLINAEIPKLDYPDFKPGPVPDDVRMEREGAVRRAEQAKSFNRFAQGFVTPGAPQAAPANAGGGAAPARPMTAPVADASKFPGGIVPSKLPPRLMQGKVRSARSMRQAMAPQPNPSPAAPGANPAAPAGSDEAQTE